jgi:heme-degrading monooxygenase HmoA
VLKITTIAKDRQLVTLINVFEVSPEDQRELVDVLVDATKSTMRRLPGFISANIHRGLDGTRVANYAQWESREAFEAMLANREAQVHMEAATRLASFEPALYEVAYVDGPGEDG